MDDIALQTIENELGKELPSFYKDTMQSYPFELTSFAAEFLLFNDLEQISEHNNIQSEVIPSDVYYCIGSDGGEHTYYVKFNCTVGTVYEYSLETDVIREYSSTWESHLSDIAKTLLDIAEDEKLAETRRLNKKWWQFWI